MADTEVKEGLRKSILKAVFDVADGEALPRARAEAAYDELDLDKSGGVDVNEFAASVSGGKQDQESLDVAKLVIAVFDEDGDGEISRDEFVDFLCTEPPAAAAATVVSEQEVMTIRMFLLQQVFAAEDSSQLDRAKVEDMYRQFDADGNGSLDGAEFAVAAERLGFEGLTPPELKLCMGLFDGDGDGCITQAEFVEFFLQVGGGAGGDGDGGGGGGEEQGEGEGEAGGAKPPQPPPAPPTERERAMIRSFLLDNVFQVTSAKQLTPAFVAKAFEKADADGSGSISVAEFGKVLGGLGFGDVSEAELKLGLACFDLDGDGTVNWHEFETFFFEDKARTFAHFEVGQPKQQKHLLEVLKASEGHEHLKAEMLKFYAQHDKSKIRRVDQMVQRHYCGKL